MLINDEKALRRYIKTETEILRQIQDALKDYRKKEQITQQNLESAKQKLLQYKKLQHQK